MPGGDAAGCCLIPSSQISLETYYPGRSPESGRRFRQGKSDLGNSIFIDSGAGEKIQDVLDFFHEQRGFAPSLVCLRAGADGRIRDPEPRHVPAEALQLVQDAVKQVDK